MSVFPPNCYWNKAHETGSHSKPWAPPVWDQEMVKTTGLNVRQSEHGHRERWQKKECFSCTASDSNQSSRPPYVLCKSLSCPHYPPHTLTATPPSVTWPLPVWRLLKAGLTFILVSYVSRDMNLLTSTLSSIFTILKMFKKRNRDVETTLVTTPDFKCQLVCKRSDFKACHQHEVHIPVKVCETEMNLCTQWTPHIGPLTCSFMASL